MKLATRFLVACLFACTACPALAEEYKPDDRVSFDLVAEGWAATTTARVTVDVNAAVAGASAGTMRADMQKAVNDVAKSEWRLIGFSRSQDSTGLERWNAQFEARVAENALGGIHDTAKKLSKAGMQLTITEIAFDPTLAEIEAVKAKLRGELYKQINDQLAVLNAAVPGRQYRVGTVDFNGVGGGVPPMAPRPMMMKATMMAMDGSVASSEGGAPMSREQKITQHVFVTFAALPPAPSPAPAK